MLFESLSHVINQESHVYSWNFGKIYLVLFLKFWYLVSLGRFQYFKKVNSLNLSQISLLNMWLLVQIYCTPPLMFFLNIAKFLRTSISKNICSVSSCFCIDSFIKFRSFINMLRTIILLTIQLKYINLCFISKRLIHVT